jgi:hypothetical protein
MSAALVAWLVLLLANSYSNAQIDQTPQSTERIVTFDGGSAKVTTVNGAERVEQLDSKGNPGARSACNPVTGTYDEIVSFYHAFQNAIATGSRKRLATMVSYPLRINVVATKRGQRLISSPAEFIERYHTIFPDPLIKRIQAAIPEKVFCKGEDAMLGDGVVWESELHVFVVNQWDSDAPRTK